MSTSFNDYAARRKAEWTEDQRTAYEAASQVFDAERRSHVELGANLAARRAALHMTQPRLAELAGIQQSEISRIERGVANPTLSTMDRLSRVLGLEVALIASPTPETQHGHA